MSSETVGVLGAIVLVLAGVSMLRAIFVAVFRPGKRGRGVARMVITPAVAVAVLAGIGLLVDPDASSDDSTPATAQTGASEGGAAPPAEAEASITLDEYADLGADARTDFIERAMKGAETPESTLQDFRNCMGNMAFEKSGDLDARKVFGWCDMDRKNDPEQFQSYFNELAAEDLSTYAVTLCRDLVREKLVAPSTADFPWFSDQTFYKRRHRYFVNSHLDAQNEFGAMIRLRYQCDVQYGGTGDEARASSWTVHHLNVFRP